MKESWFISAYVRYRASMKSGENAPEVQKVLATIKKKNKMNAISHVTKDHHTKEMGWVGKPNVPNDDQQPGFPVYYHRPLDSKEAVTKAKPPVVVVLHSKPGLLNESVWRYV
jgi:hypothetical protein